MVLPLALSFFLLSLASSSSGASILHPWLPRTSSRSSPPPFLLPLLASWAVILVVLCLSGLVTGDGARETGRSSSHKSGELSPEQQTRVPCVSQHLGFPGFPAPPPQPWPVASILLGQRRDDGNGDGDATSFSSKVWIFPPLLEWGKRPLFSPSALPVTISNRSNSTLLTIASVLSSSVQFYAGAAPRELQPGEEATLEVVFLPQSLGRAQAVVLLHTSAGDLFVQVHGNGVASPFGLAPLERSRLLPGQTLHRTISLRNNDDGEGGKAIRVKEARSWPADSSNRTLVLTNPGNDGVGVTRCCSLDSSSCSCVGDDRDDAGSYLSMRPGAAWGIDPGRTSSVLELHFNAGGTAGNWNGYVYLGLTLSSASSSSPSTEAGEEEEEEEEAGEEQQLLIPFNVRVGGQAQVLQAVPEVMSFGFLSNRREVRKQGLELRNTGPDSVEVKQITRQSPGDRKNLIAVRYRKGLVVRPGTQAQVAVAWYRGVEESSSLSLVSDGVGSEQLVIHTNGSNTVRVPLHAVVLHGSTEDEDEEEDDAAGAAGAGADEERVIFPGCHADVKLSQLEKLERRTFGQEELESGIFPGGGVEVDGHQQLIASQPLFSVQQSGVMLPAVQVGSSEAVWLRLRNPSGGPVSVKLLVSHEWEASGCHCSGGDADSSPADCRARDDMSVVVLQESGGVSQTLLGAYQEAELGPLLFRPTRRCTWTGVVAVINNLTGVDWIPVRGTGSSAELRFLLEDNAPVDILRLGGTALRGVSTVTSGIDESLSSLSEKTSSAPCKQPLNGSFLARNTGDIPLRVDSVALMSGGCSSQGFELGSCGGFLLAAGEAAQIKLSYSSSDFVSPKVRHNSLHLVTSIGIVDIPVVVVLPDHMLNLCANIPAFFKYRKLFVYAGFFGLLCTVLALPSKVGGKKLHSADCDGGSGMASTLPLFSPSSMIAEESASPAKLSKIRVKVTEELPRDARDEASEDSMSTVTAPSSGFLQVTKQQQQHSIAMMSPGSSPRKSQLERGGKRKRKKGPVSLVKQEASRSGTCSPVSSPASPLGSQRPASPLFPPDAENSSKVSRLDVEVGRRIVSSSSLSSPPSGTSAHWVPKDETRKKAGEPKPSKEKHQHQHQHQQQPRVSGTPPSVARRSSAPETGKASPTPSTLGNGVPAKKKTLTASATFPNSSRQISPSARAPGSKIPKGNGTSTTSSSSSDAGSELNDSSSSSSCNTSSRFSGDDIVEQTSTCSMDLVYDIWGDHLGDMTRRQSKVGGEETHSLFSVPAFPVSTQQQQQQQPAAMMERSAEFSMFSGNAVAAFNRGLAANQQPQPQQEQQDYSSSSYFLFDLSYNKRVHF